MDYYLKQASLIKRIAKKSNPELAATSAPVQTNALTFGNNNDTDYSEQAKNKLSSFITDPDKLDQITTALYSDNDKYLKELVINWPDYESKLQSLKGSVVSVKRVVDVLEDKLQEALGKKQIKKDKTIVEERKNEGEERNMMGQEDVLAKSIRAKERENEANERNMMGDEDTIGQNLRENVKNSRKKANEKGQLMKDVLSDIALSKEDRLELEELTKKVNEIPAECDAIVNIQLMKLMEQKNNTAQKLIEFLEKYSLLNANEKEILSKRATKQVDRDKKAKLKSDKFNKIQNMLNNFNGKNSILFMVENTVNTEGYQTIRDFIQDLLIPKDFKGLISRIQNMKDDIRKFNDFTSKRVEAATEYKEGTGMKVINGYGLKQNEKVVNNKYYVNEDLLKNNGILEIRYVKNRHLAHVKPPMLSEKCKDCVVSMINGGKINHDNFVSLTQFEKDMLRKIDNLFNTNQNLHDDDEDNFHKSFQLLKGSYLAGNDNQQIKNQLRQYIFHAHEIGKLSRSNRDKMLFELKLL